LESILSQSSESSGAVESFPQAERVEEKRAPNLLPAVLVLGVLLWIIATTGGGQIFVKEVLGEAYDSQAEHFLRGEATVDGGAIQHECMVVNGKSYMYFGPFPAFVRMPLNFVYPSGRGHWSRITGFCAGMIALVAFAGIVRLGLRSCQLSSGWKNVLGNACMVGFAFASPLLLLLGNVSIYNEAIIWGFAWSIAALYFLLRSREAEGAALTWHLLGFSFCAGAALLSRATFGAPFLLIAPLVAFSLFRRNPIRNLIALFLPLGLAFLFNIMLTYARFGGLNAVPLKYSINYVQREFALKHGLFRLERVPYSFADYFFLRYPERQRQPPFLQSRRHPYNYPSLYVMDFTETYSSLLWCSSWIALGAVIGIALLVRPRGADWLTRGMAICFFAEVVGILSYMGLCQRYVAELFPFLIFAFVLFLRQGKAVFQLRYVLTALIAVSVVINSLSTVSWLLDADMNVPAATKTKWNEFLGRTSRLPGS
jgi:hypothetical protein